MITGASSGLGKEIALEYSRREGVTLLLVARNKERLAQTQLECERNGAKVFLFICDISKEEECKYPSTHLGKFASRFHRQHRLLTSWSSTPGSMLTISSKTYNP